MKDVKVPVLFQTLKNIDIEDTRFTKVKIWLMHLGDNLNGTSFSQESVQRAIPTLSYTPIMGLIEEEDFKGHETELIVNENEYRFKTLTQAYGVIPDDNNAQFEDRVGDDGITRTYLTVDGLLWNKWEDAVNVLNSKEGKTGQSMEINVLDYSSDNEFGVKDITNFQFDGACLLGDAVRPAMVNASVEYASSDKVDKIIKEKLAVYSKLEEGGNKLPTKEEDKKEVKFDENTENTEPEVVLEETPTNEGGDESTPAEPEKEPEVLPEEPPTEEPVETEPTPEPEEPVEPEPEVPETPEEPEEDSKPAEPEEEKVDKDEPTVLKETTITEARKAVNTHDDLIQQGIDRIVVGENVYTAEEATELIEKYFELTSNLHKQAVDNLFAEYAEDLTDDDMKTIKEDAYSKEIKDIETLIFAAIGRNKYSKKQKESSNVNFSAVTVETETQTDKPYNGALEKYLNL